MKIGFALVAALAFGVMEVLSTEETFTASDTYIWALQPDATFGSVGDITVDLSDGGEPTQALMKFPTLAVPAGATLVEATLSVFTNSASGGTVSAYR